MRGLEQVLRRMVWTVLVLAAVVLTALPVMADQTPEGEWGNWRGPGKTGEAAEGSAPPVSWSEEQNVRWKIAVPGKGLASPVIWGDRIFLTTAVPTDKKVELEIPENETERERAWRLRGVQPETVQRYTVMALDRATGKVLWQDAPVEELPHEGTHGDASWASASPVTDGEHLVVSFGSRGIFGYTLDGKLLWSKDLGDMQTRNGFGEGSSPALHGDTVVINWDHEGEDFIVALDKATGEERWRRQRDEPTSWSTPLVVEHGGRAQVVVAATEATRAYDLKTGDLLWEVPGMTLNTIPTPVEQDGVVFVMSGFRGNAVQAIRLGEAAQQGAEEGGEEGSGPSRILWSLDRDTPYVPSPVLYQGTLYFLKSNNGILTAVNATTGEVLYGPERLPGVSGVYASPVAAQGKVYIVGRDGTSLVLRHGPKFEVLATNTLDDRFDASPAIVGDELYLRGHEHLYAIVEASEQEMGEEAAASR